MNGERHLLVKNWPRVRFQGSLVVTPPRGGLQVRQGGTFRNLHQLLKAWPQTSSGSYSWEPITTTESQNLRHIWARSSISPRCTGKGMCIRIREVCSESVVLPLAAGQHHLENFQRDPGR